MKTHCVVEYSMSVTPFLYVVVFLMRDDERLGGDQSVVALLISLCYAYIGYNPIMIRRIELLSLPF